MKNTSIRLSAEAEKALGWLKEQTGGFNLSKAINQLIILTAKAKGWLGCLLAVVLLAGCGDGGGQPVVGRTPGATGVYYDAVGYHSISNKMLPDTALSIQDDFAKTKQCVREHYAGPVYDGIPRIVEFAGVFTCFGQWASRGCTDTSTDTITIAIADVPGFTNPHYALSHEAIHWLTGLGNEYHGSPLFTACELPI